MSKSIVDVYGPPRGSLCVGIYPIVNGKPDLERPTRLLCMENRVLFGGADIQARLIGGDSEFKIGAMYFEYENLTSPSDPIVAPSFDRSGGLAYYQSLPSPKDYLRVPITVGATILSSDALLYVGNQTTFFALTGGTAGVLGRPFAAGSNSTVYGVALAATPVLADPTQDIVFSRAYFPDDGSGSNKFLKTVGASIGNSWPIRFN